MYDELDMIVKVWKKSWKYIEEQSKNRINKRGNPKWPEGCAVAMEVCRDPIIENCYDGTKQGLKELIDRDFLDLYIHEAITTWMWSKNKIAYNLTRLVREDIDAEYEEKFCDEKVGINLSVFRENPGRCIFLPQDLADNICGILLRTDYDMKKKKMYLVVQLLCAKSLFFMDSLYSLNCKTTTASIYIPDNDRLTEENMNKHCKGSTDMSIEGNDLRDAIVKAIIAARKILSGEVKFTRIVKPNKKGKKKGNNVTTVLVERKKDD